MIPRSLVTTIASILLALLLVPAGSPLPAAAETLPIPPEVWARYDPDAGDFKEEIVSEETKDGIYRRDSYISAYVNGEEIRVFCTYAVKAGARNAPGLLDVHGWMSYPKIDLSYVQDGWAVMAHDYRGRSLSKNASGLPCTIYPESMSHGLMDRQVPNARQIKATLPDGSDITAPEQTSDYLWYAIQRRVLSYLLAQKEVDQTRIGARGYSYGGTLMWNLAMDSRVKAVVAYFGIGWIDYYRDRNVWMYEVPPKNQPPTPGEELVLAAVAPESHAPHIKAACLWLNGSNDHHGGQERGEQTFGMFQPGVPWSFAHQARGHHNTDKLGNDCKLWLEKYVLDKAIDWPARPTTEIRLDAEGVPEFVLTPATVTGLDTVEAWYALKEPVSFIRHWRDAKLERRGDTWVASLPVANVDDYVFAFANLTYSGSYEGSIVISSDFTAVIPSQLGTAVATDTRADSLAGDDSPWSDTSPVEGVGGVMGIRPLNKNRGMTCSTLSDPKWKAPKGAVLSFKYYCTQPQTLILDAGSNFTATIDIAASDDWQSMQIPAGQLQRGASGQALPDWSTVSQITLKSAPGEDITKVIFADIKWVPGTR